MKRNQIPRLTTPMLPFQKRVVFVDWHGVVSCDPFWFSILENRSHKFHSELERSLSNLFHNKTADVLDWMRGRFNYREIIHLLDISERLQSDIKFLEKRLLRDCKRMRGEQLLLAQLEKIRSSNYIVLATDNMDCFSETVDEIAWVRNSFDALLCSCEMGVTKHDSIEEFFGPWLKQHNLGFRDAILLDDSERNCIGFEKLGGRSIHVRSTEMAIRQIALLKDCFISNT